MSLFSSIGKIVPNGSLKQMGQISSDIAGYMSLGLMGAADLARSFSDYPADKPTFVDSPELPLEVGGAVVDQVAGPWDDKLWSLIKLGIFGVAAFTLYQVMKK
ncbi:MAG: hypothetical protein ABEJ98_05210 [Candidatus Nanohaloarchaea archaeon]